MSTAKRILLIGGCISLAIAVFQAVVSFSPAWSLYFGAPLEIVKHRWLLLISGEITAVIFGIFGIYGLSGAGFVRRLIVLRSGLALISAIYILRGFMIVPELLIIWEIFSSSAVVTPQGLISSLVSLAVGLIYMIGTGGAWRDLSMKKDN